MTWMRIVITPRFGSVTVNVTTPFESETTAGPTFCHLPLMFFCTLADLPINLGNNWALIVKARAFVADTGRSI
jgi:hypothetical protein